jgi:hypothetical protein
MDEIDERAIDERIQAVIRQLPPLPIWTAHERMAYLLDRIGAADIYVCPHHATTGGYESCCECEGWQDDDPNHGRRCTEAES